MSEINYEKSVIFFTSMIVQKAGPVSTWCRSVVGGVVCTCEQSHLADFDCDCAMHLSTSEILYGDKRRQLCEIQFAWSLNPTWHNRRGLHIYISLNWPRLKSCHAVFRRENCSGPGLRSVTGQRTAKRMQAVRSHVTKIWVASKTSYSRNARCYIIIIASLWNSTDISAVLPQMGLSYFRAIGNV